MNRALVVGTGGHSRVIVAMLKAIPHSDIMGVLDLGEPIPGEKILDVPALGPVSLLGSLGDPGSIDAYLAIGDNASRREWFQRLKEMGFSLPNLISSHAIVDLHTQMGKGNVICPRAYIGPGAVIGDNNLVNTAAVLEHEVRIGNHCHFAPSSTIAGRTVIGDETFIGAGATVIDRIHVAEQTTVGAGAVVLKSIERPGETYVGVPACSLAMRRPGR